MKRYNELMFQRLKQNIILPDALYNLLSNPDMESIHRFTHMDFTDYVFWPTDESYVSSVENEGPEPRTPENKIISVPEPRTPENKIMVNILKETGDEREAKTVKEVEGTILPTESPAEVNLNQTTECESIDQLRTKPQPGNPGKVQCEVELNAQIESTLNVSNPEHSCASHNDSIHSVGQSPTKQETFQYTPLLGNNIFG